MFPIRTSLIKDKDDLIESLRCTREEITDLLLPFIHNIISRSSERATLEDQLKKYENGPNP